MPRAAGIDLGTEALRGVVVEKSRGRLQVIAAGASSLGEQAALEDSPDRRTAVVDKLKELVRAARLKAPVRRVAAPAKKGTLRYLSVPPVPPWRLEMLARYEVEEHGDDRTVQAYDYRILDVPDVAGQYSVLLGCCQEETVQWLLDGARRAGLGEVEVDLKAVALYNAYYHGHGFDPDKTVLVVDIGADSVTALVVRNGALFLARSFEGGGRRFSQVLADELKTTVLEAEAIQKGEAEILFDLPTGGAAGGAGLARLRTGRTLRLTATGMLRRPGEAAAPGEAGAPAKPPPAQAEPVSPVPEDLTLSESKSDAGLAPTVLKPLDAGAQPEAPAPGTPELPLTVELEPAPAATESSPPALGAPPGEATAEPPTLPVTPVEPLDPNAEKRRRTISQALVREAAALCAAVENAANYCRQQYKLNDFKVDVVYLTGGGSRLKGLPKLLSRRLRAPVEPLQVFRKVNLDRLPTEAAETLKAEQDTMAVATGLALSELCRGAFSLLLWPTPLKEKKQFWARTAYLYYAAVGLVGALALFWLTPWRNARILNANKEVAATELKAAEEAQAKLDAADEDHEELYNRIERIDLNAKSGEFFLEVLDALKDPKRMPNRVYLVSMSTTLPAVVLQESEPAPAPGGLTPPGAGAAKQAAAANVTPDTFQAQAKVYLRGFVRSDQKEDLYGLIKGDREKKPFVPGFCDLLVPHPENPDHPDNVFRDIRPVWIEMEDHRSGTAFLKEFVLEAFVEGTREVVKQKGVAGPPPSAKAPAQPKAGDAKAKPAEKAPAPGTAPALTPKATPTPGPEAAPAPTPPAPAPTPGAAPAPAPEATPAPTPGAAPAPAPAPEATPAPTPGAAPAPEAAHAPKNEQP